MMAISDVKKRRLLLMFTKKAKRFKNEKERMLKKQMRCCHMLIAVFILVNEPIGDKMTSDNGRVFATVKGE